MITRLELEKYLNEYLLVENFSDYCPNGLQVEGKSNIKKIVTGVTASKLFLDKSLEAGADAIIVHHGYFWKGESEVITGVKKNRLSLLLSNDINLFAYHLPLDCHEGLGNNAEIAKLLGFNIKGVLTKHYGAEVGNFGELESELEAEAFSNLILEKLGRKPLYLAGSENGSSRKIKKVAWCTGAAQGFIEEAAKQNVDAYLSGEVSEKTTHLARELGVDYFACGHHATERYGVLALGKHLADKFSIEHEFIDVDNPV